MNSDGLYLNHILECIRRIEDYTSVGEDEFLHDSMRQDAVLRNLHTFAESTQRLSDEFKESLPNVDWRMIARFRNIVVHDYLGINLDRVWQIVEIDLPDLKERLIAAVERNDESEA